MFITHQRREKLEQDIAFLRAEIIELQAKKEAAEMFENNLIAKACAKDIAEITGTIQRIEKDISRLDQEFPILNLAS